MKPGLGPSYNAFRCLPMAGQLPSWSPGRALAQQGGQHADVGFFDPAPAVWAGVISAALTDLAAVVDGDLPGAVRDGRDRGALALTQVPAHGVDELVARPGGQGVQLLDEPVAGAGPSQVTISRRR
jgi:hypothetical protein